MSESRAQSWLDRGGYFSWRPDDGDAEPVEVFHLEAGDPNAPTLLLVHGFPTSSIDWYGVVDRLAKRFHVCALDFPGYGFSDKPVGWGYRLIRDARLLSHYLTEVVGTESATVIAHDRGDSVALILAGGHAGEAPAVDIDHLVLSNANIYLPLSNLTMAQRLMLDENTAADLLDNATPELLAQGMGAATFWPPRGADDPVVGALTETFAHQDGVRVMHETIQYLVERADDEDTLARLPRDLRRPDNRDLGPQRHRLPSPRRELGLEQPPDAEARPQRPLLHLRRRPLSPGRSPGRLRGCRSSLPRRDRRGGARRDRGLSGIADPRGSRARSDAERPGRPPRVTNVRLRPARAGDAEPIAAIWVPGWREAHEGRVPDALIEHRSPAELRARVPSMIDGATVAIVEGAVAGFVVVRDDEIEQMYVGEGFRGTGAAGRLLAHGESLIARHFDRGWLAVVAGNDRAIGFYERQGWRDQGRFDHITWTPDGGTIAVPCRRYEKVVKSYL